MASSISMMRQKTVAMSCVKLMRMPDSVVCTVSMYLLENNTAVFELIMIVLTISASKISSVIICHL
jgi:hypothetical protein